MMNYKFKMYKNKDITVNVYIKPEFLDENIEETIIDKVNNLILKKEIKNVGLITQIKNIKTVGGGKIQLDSTQSKFSVQLLVEVYLPKLYQKIETTVKEVSFHGYRVDEPVEIFIATEGKPKVLEGDKVTIKITKITYNRKNFIIIAKQI